MAHAQTPEHPWVLPRGQLRHPAGGRQVRPRAELGLGPGRAGAEVGAPLRALPEHSPPHRLSGGLCSPVPKYK